MNRSSGTVSVVDTDPTTYAVRATVPIGLNPYAAAVSSDGGKVYVTVAGTGEVAIRTTDNTVVDTISVGTAPVSIAIHGTLAYVANQTAETVSVIDTTTDEVIDTITVDFHPAAVAVSPDGSLLYLANASDANVTVIEVGRVEV